ncbi:MAG: hypothetical protein GEV11_24700 [Streptosporangiales bacterium]|nr:hypothetical protein [Streptosporangiales bacterium]
MPVVRGLPSVPAPSPNEPEVPSLRPVAGAPGESDAAADARAAAGDKASTPAAGVRASALVMTGEEATGHGAARPRAGTAGGAEHPAAPHPASPHPASPASPASPGSSGAVRTGTVGEPVPLGTPRTGLRPYGTRLLALAAPAARDAWPAARTAADEPTFSPD